MAKFSFKRPRIISKKFSGMSSSVDNVTKSLNDLVFSYANKADRAIQKKHVMMGISSIVLLLVLGSFISPKGKAESSVFYPENCLGGWVNPQYAEGEEQTTSNGDVSQFTKNNSAVLPKNTNAEMYCGNFKGKFNQATKPTKIIVSLALTKGDDLLLEDTLESGVVSSSSLEAITSSSTVSTSTIDILILASSTATSTYESTTSSTATDIVPTVTGTQPTPLQDTTSAIGSMMQSVKDGINSIFENNKTPSSQTDTVVVPLDTTPNHQTPPVTPAPSQSDQSPTSYVPEIYTKISAHFFQKAFAQESSLDVQEVTDLPLKDTSLDTHKDIVTSPDATSSSESLSKIIDSVPVASLDATTSVDIMISTSTEDTASSTESVASTTETVVTTPTNDTHFENNFLEVFYTFDGVDWVSLGQLNEISMKYRTFEIPVLASTTWKDMSHLQIKVVATRHDQDTPTVYLDGIKVEVLYESELTHVHPDFARDTILKDETMEGIRIVTIINSENSLQEIWYTYLDPMSDERAIEASSTIVSTSTDLIQLREDLATSTESTTSPTKVENASSTGSTTPFVLNVPKHGWKKYLGTDLTLSTKILVEAIKKQEFVEQEENRDVLPDFASDTVKRLKGTFFQSVVVQIERTIQDVTRDELWLYDLDKNTEEKIGEASSTTITPESPLGIKDGYLFWISVDKTLVYAYDLNNRVVSSKLLPVFDPSKGQRAEINFDNFQWKVIVGGNGFSFYSKDTGEVFSDENSQAVAILRQKLGLDAVMSKEEQGNLGLPVEADSPQ